MGRGSGGTRGEPWKWTNETGRGGDDNIEIEFVVPESLKNIENPGLYGEVKAAISRYHSALGVRQQNVKLADLDADVLGVHMTSTAMGKSTGVYLNSDYFKKGTIASIVKLQKGNYESGLGTPTLKPVAHTVTHELAHATWNSRLKGAKYEKAGKALVRLATQWQKEKPKGYGTYARTNINEWFAETVTKAIHGTSDKYTTGVKAIIKKYGL